MKRTHVILLNVLAFMLLLTTTIVIGNMTFDSDIIYYYSDGDISHKDFGITHIIFMTLSVLFTVSSAVLLIQELIQWSDKDKGWLGFLYFDKDGKEIKENTPTKSNKKYLYWIITIILLIVLYNIISPLFKQSITVYNTSKTYNNAYIQKIQEKEGFYDKMWKTYLTKEKITDVNKDLFLQVSKIIMENRKDGKNIVWKWVQENQQIPYSEFSKFYEDLSLFITQQREGYFNIEKECQMIANKNNTLLDTFPNNMINHVLKCPKIKFEYGILSDSTINVFKNKKENL